MYDQEVKMKRLYQRRIDTRQELKEMYKFYEQKKRTASLLNANQQKSKGTIVSKSDTHYHNQLNLVSFNLLRLDKQYRKSNGNDAKNSIKLK